MATQKQTDANRQNALRSTGPRTEHGKSRSRANAFIHGLACMTIYKPIRHEDAAQYHEMRAELVNAWQPWDAKEFQLVELAASAYKRIQRSEAYESALFTGSMEGRQQKRKKPIKVTKNDDLGCGIMIGDEQIQLSWDNLDRYRRNAWTDYNRAITQLSKMQKERKSAPVEELKKSEREERAEIRHREYLKRTVAPLVRWRNNPANADKLASFRQDETGAIVPVDVTPETPDTQPIPVPEAA